jgi:hypothetical protein
MVWISNYECMGEKRQRQSKVRQKQMQILHSIATVKGNSRFLHCGGKCAAFGRNDGGLGVGRNATTAATLKQKAKSKCREWAVSAQLFAFRVAGSCLGPLHFLGGQFAKNTL